jgi:hypothetical protein
MTPKDVEFVKTLDPIPDHWGGLGATRLHVDPRDYDIRILPGVAEALAAGVPAAADLTGFIRGEVLNQGATGACVAFSTAHLCAMDTVIEGQAWPNINAPLMYSRAGGTGSNGVDSRLVLNQTVDDGAPLMAGGAVHPIKSYAFVPQQAGIFTDTIKAAVAAGYPCTLALLLPADFGWRSGNAARTAGYHQVMICGYTADGYWIILNSWGPGWPGGGGSPHPGVGSILMSYCEMDGLQNRYCYVYTVAAVDVNPPPPPPQVTVTGYNPNPALSGARFSIAGSNFDRGSPVITWQGFTLPVLGVNPDTLATQAPAITATQSGPVHVQSGPTGADGPPLTVQADLGPPPVKVSNVVGKASGDNVGQLQTNTPYTMANPPGVVVNFSQVTQDGGPPPPNQLSVTGYSPNPVKAGASFTIQGQGFTGGNLTVSWQGAVLTATRLSDAQIQAVAPSVAAPASGAVTVQVEGAFGTGPPLTVQPADVQPPPVGDIKVMVSAKPSQFRNTVSVICYTADKDGQSLPCSVSGTVTGSKGTTQLWGQTTHGTSGPAIWSIARPAEWGEPCQIVVTAAGSGGTSGTGTATG